MINIAVCVKQVAAFSRNSVDLSTGLIKRESLPSSINQNDLSALEAAFQTREFIIKQGLMCEVHAFSMGPKSAEKMLINTFSLGVDKAFLLNDKHFAGSDVISTSYTLAQGIKSIEKLLNIHYSVIVCANQTSDGGTSFVHTALATQLDYPLIPYLHSIDFTNNFINNPFEAFQEMENCLYKVKSNMPLVVSVLPEHFPPRLPTLKFKMQAKGKNVKILSLDDLEDKNKYNYGLLGAKTKVIKSYEPKFTQSHQALSTEEYTYEQLSEKIMLFINE